MINPKLKVLMSDYLRKAFVASKELVSFIRQCLGSKKIVVISEKGISSMPVSFRFQASCIAFVFAFMLWVSYSTGKYFAYESTISKKDFEIWTTNISNENLQYQVADLHDNLMELNKYFDNIKKYGPISELGTEEKAPGAAKQANKNVKDADANSENGVRGVLSNIRNKVMERIENLESIIEMTGLKVDQVANQNDSLRRVMIHKDAEKHQGGEFIPLDDKDAADFNNNTFDKEVNYLMQLEKVVRTFPVSPPMPHYWVSSEFGGRIDPIRRTGAIHTGVDLVGGDKAKVFSSAPGKVRFSGFYGAYGRLIEIDHGSGITTRYGHLEKILVEEGEPIEKGQLIGIQGNSGRSTGTHLHYEVRYNNKAYDPKNFLKAGKYVF
ncbi:MAG: peptidase [Rickettsiaceae bacterium]|nr:peptidase [Rickettsiaceae bacterium]